MAFPTAAKLMHDIVVRRESAVQRTQMETGPAKQAAVRSKVLVTREVQYAFKTLTDYNAFIVWFNGDAGRGALWFFWTDPVDDVSKLSRIVDGLIEEERPNKTMDVWVLKFKLETWE